MRSYPISDAFVRVISEDDPIVVGSRARPVARIPQALPRQRTIYDRMRGDSGNNRQMARSMTVDRRERRTTTEPVSRDKMNCLQDCRPHRI